MQRQVALILHPDAPADLCNDAGDAVDHMQTKHSSCRLSILVDSRPHSAV